jgi:hypothetical protein
MIMGSKAREKRHENKKYPLKVFGNLPIMYSSGG